MLTLFATLWYTDDLIIGLFILVNRVFYISVIRVVDTHRIIHS